MDAVAWWLIPVAATLVAIMWTAVLARRERRRADEKWRAKRMAKVGKRLAATELPQPKSTKQDSPT
ncbi:MAG: hypothetical protein H6525_11510 [Actinobacteria bacterium]|nr:hypothetical protein [Actinomycetota bacterium]MCB9413450.1 hypothetical protein [Actinomycetota bacterium]